MGCFLTCFGTSKHKKRHHLVDASPSKHQKHEAKEALQVTEPTKQEKPINPITQSKVKLEDPLSCTTKKKVTFDLNVKTYEQVSTEEVVTDVLVKNNVEKESEKKQETPKESQCISNSIASNLVSYPPNHRYQNCANIDDDFEDLDLDDDSECDCNNEGGDDEILVQDQESSESLFSLSIESRKQGCEVELGEKEVNSPMPKCVSTNEEVRAIESNQNARDRSQYVHSVLNPVENLTQWKAVKAKATPPLKYQSKENINMEQDFDIPIRLEPSFKSSTHSSKMNSNNKKLVDQEIAVDTSLSSWLVESKTTPMSKTSNNSVGNSLAKNANSPRNLEDRPILGALTIEELKQHSVSTRSRSRSPDETPIIGTVGSYWSRTGQVVDSDSSFASKGMPKIRSKNKEDERVNWNSTPFEERLERALDRGIVDV